MQCCVLGVGLELLAGMDPGGVSQGVSSVEASGGCVVHGPVSRPSFLYHFALLPS